VLDGLNLIRGLRRLQPGGGAALLRDFGDFLLQPVRWVQGKEISDGFARDDIGPGLAEILRVTGSLLTGQRHGGRDRRATDRARQRDPAPDEPQAAA
jgi:hypothetical protein